MKTSNGATMKQDDKITLKIKCFGASGEGCGDADGIKVFVPGGVPGDELKVRLTAVKKNYAAGRIVEIVKPSQDRVAAKCPASKVCGGCQWQQISYPAQLKFKMQALKKELEGSGLKGIKINEIIGMDEPWGFRNKIQYPIGKLNRRILMGYFRQGTHEIIDVPDCPIEDPRLSRTARIVKDVLNRSGHSAYDEKKGKGLFRHLLARIGQGTGEVLIMLVTNDDAIPGSRDLANEIVNKCKKAGINIVGICQNVNLRQTSVILGERSKVLWGRDHVIDELGGLKLKVSATSFYQTNPNQAKALYEKALELSGISGNDNVVDAYSGIGTIALWFARRCNSVTGIEENKKAVYDAIENAKMNKISNCRFKSGLVEALLPEMKDADILVMDPPRAGCGDGVLQSIGKSGISKIIYVSCNPETLARDISVLSSQGYKVSEVQPVDMFPHSYHIEVIAKIMN